MKCYDNSEPVSHILTTFYTVSFLNLGDVSELLKIPVKPDNTVSNGISPRISETVYDRNSQISLKQENIEMTILGKNKETEHLRVSIDNSLGETSRPLGMLADNAVAETNMNLLEESVSPLIPESFLNASQAASSSQATSPEVPPPLPTTPIPSDEDLSGSTGKKVTPRGPLTMRERFAKVVEEENKRRFEYPLRPKSPLITRRYS